MNVELKQLLEHVKAAKVNSPERVHKAIDTFFQSVTWSLLKDEWTNRMTATEKRAFCIKVFKQTRNHSDDMMHCPLCDKRTEHFEKQGLTRSDAQAAAEAEHMLSVRK